MLHEWQPEGAVTEQEGHFEDYFFTNFFDWVPSILLNKHVIHFYSSTAYDWVF